MSKRQRICSFFRVTRPIDKSIRVIVQNLFTTQQATTLITAVFPCTLMGLRWVLDATFSTASNQEFFWAIVLVRDGNTVNTILLADGNTLYEPEQNVLAWGHGSPRDADVGGGPVAQHIEGKSQTMRKLMVGDAVVLIQLSAAVAGSLQGAVQFFCKS